MEGRAQGRALRKSPKQVPQASPPVWPLQEVDRWRSEWGCASAARGSVSSGTDHHRPLGACVAVVMAMSIAKAPGLVVRVLRVSVV